MMKHDILSTDIAAWGRIQALYAHETVPLIIDIKLATDTRTLAQNNLMWDMLGDIARQVTWHGMKLGKEDWKDMLTASLKKQRVVPSIDGVGFVVLGERTSKMSIKQMSDVITLAQAFGVEHDVKFKSHREECVDGE